MLCRKISATAGLALAVVIVCPLAAAQGLPRADERITTMHECIDNCEARRTKVIEKCERWNDAHRRLACYRGAAKGNVRCLLDCVAEPPKNTERPGRTSQ